MATTKKSESQYDVEYRSPAAILAASRGEKTFVVNIRPRHSADDFRVMEVDNNPKARIPTDVDVEVAENEYVAIKNSSNIRRNRIKTMKNLAKKTADSGALANKTADSGAL